MLTSISMRRASSEPAPFAKRRRGASLKMGRIRGRPVGPHPDWSCQLAFAPEVFGELVPWLAIHRQDLVVFIHPVTGNDLLDHRDRAIWMGSHSPAGPVDPGRRPATL